MSRDGIHVTTVNSTDTRIHLRVDHPSGRFGPGVLPPGRLDQVFFNPPGHLELLCHNGDPPAGAVPVILDVVDPDGLWVSNLCNTIGGQTRTPSESGYTDAEPISIWLSRG